MAPDFLLLTNNYRHHNYRARTVLSHSAMHHQEARGRTYSASAFSHWVFTIDVTLLTTVYARDMLSYYSSRKRCLGTPPPLFCCYVVMLLCWGDFSFCSSCRVASVCVCLFPYSREIRLLSTLCCFQRYIADFTSSIQIFPASKKQ